MPVGDFTRCTGVQDLQLNLKEADGCVTNCLGPWKGCCVGCAAYWCCCLGCTALYGSAGGEEATVSIQGDAESAFDDKVGARLGQMVEDAGKTVQAL